MTSFMNHVTAAERGGEGVTEPRFLLTVGTRTSSTALLRALQASE